MIVPSMNLRMSVSEVERSSAVVICRGSIDHHGASSMALRCFGESQDSFAVLSKVRAIDDPHQVLAI